VYHHLLLFDSFVLVPVPASAPAFDVGALALPSWMVVDGFFLHLGTWGMIATMMPSCCYPFDNPRHSNLRTIFFV
jgi:hypothetical protein